MRVTQHVNPTASAKRVASSTASNLIVLLTMDWTQYRHLGMTLELRDRVIAGLRDGSVDPLVLCEVLGVPTTAANVNAELLASAREGLERAQERGLRVLGAA